jgi:hypothetical protein
MAMRTARPRASASACAGLRKLSMARRPAKSVATVSQDSLPVPMASRIEAK